MLGTCLPRLPTLLPLSLACLPGHLQTKERCKAEGSQCDCQCLACDLADASAVQALADKALAGGDVHVAIMSAVVFVDNDNPLQGARGGGGPCMAAWGCSLGLAEQRHTLRPSMLCLPCPRVNLPCCRCYILPCLAGCRQPR